MLLPRIERGILPLRVARCTTKPKEPTVLSFKIFEFISYRLLPFFQNDAWSVRCDVGLAQRYGVFECSCLYFSHACGDSGSQSLFFSFKKREMNELKLSDEFFSFPSLGPFHPKAEIFSKSLKQGWKNLLMPTDYFGATITVNEDRQIQRDPKHAPRPCIAR